MDVNEKNRRIYDLLVRKACENIIPLNQAQKYGYSAETAARKNGEVYLAKDVLQRAGYDLEKILS